MNSVAVFLDEEGNTSSLDKNGTINLYVKEGEYWALENSYPFTLEDGLSLIGLRRSLLNIISKLGDCKILVAESISGQLFSVLESVSFSTYEVSGRPEQFLDSVLHQEELYIQKQLLEATQAQDEFFPDKIDDYGNYSIDLKTILDTNATATSKQILMPFIKAGDFNQLDVICDHVPKWFERELPSMGYSFHVAKRKDGNTCASIFTKHQD